MSKFLIFLKLLEGKTEISFCIVFSSVRFPACLVPKIIWDKNIKTNKPKVLLKISIYHIIMAQCFIALISICNGKKHEHELGGGGHLILRPPL